MKAHLAYLSYVLRHKWFVLQAGLRLGVPFWRLLVHDWTKFTPAEWGPYVRNFYNPDGTKRRVRNPDGSYDPARQSPAFDYAWLHHQRNKHHWEAWCIVGHHGEVKPLVMPETYVREMIADWIGAGQANGQNDVRGWWEANRQKMALHPVTRQRIEDLLSFLTKT